VEQSVEIVDNWPRRAMGSGAGPSSRTPAGAFAGASPRPRSSARPDTKC
jgi:hypothetical protein